MLLPGQLHVLEKAVWTEADFDRMSWHDVVIHALAFDTTNHELLLDIDYMFAWVDPEPPSKYYTFWMAPCTLVFRNVTDFKASIDCGLGLQLQGIMRTDHRSPRNVDSIAEKTEWTWTLDANEGEISFSSVGYTQFTRKAPTLSMSQSFDLNARGGISFMKTLG
jgi:hypothetical protein